MAKNPANKTNKTNKKGLRVNFQVDWGFSLTARNVRRTLVAVVPLVALLVAAMGGPAVRIF
ncbi:hypothetical protein ACPA54_30440 [Uniformispora flossi]|uniref:hypothetical protein n=1 Tax=Uniformispora flossi TaxID=3390723 RepID=UPI003C2B4891